MPFIAVFILAMFVTGGNLAVSIIVGIVFGCVLALAWGVVILMGDLATGTKRGRRK